MNQYLSPQGGLAIVDSQAPKCDEYCRFLGQNHKVSTSTTTLAHVAICFWIRLRNHGRGCTP